MVSSPSPFDATDDATGADASVGASASHSIAGVDSIVRLPGTVALPPFQSDFSVSQRHEVNPAIALNLLKDIQAKVSLWHEQLREVVQALHRLHAQGPMVDGWLESSSEANQSAHAPAAASILRHGDADALMKYIEALGDQASNLSAHQVNVADQPFGSSLEGVCQNHGAVPEAGATGATQYRLCSLDENGRVRSQPCPPEQMGIVSVAIARYQNYKQLLAKRRAIEAKLQLAVDQLTDVRSALQQED
ncbi:MAG: hypothetical protein AAFP20_03425 [Cyanobacteria bacterium J06614_10]